RRAGRSLWRSPRITWPRCANTSLMCSPMSSSRPWGRSSRSSPIGCAPSDRGEIRHLNVSSPHKFETLRTMRTLVHLMRHGEVHNPDSILYGRLPGYNLSELGHQMAQMVADDLQIR